MTTKPISGTREWSVASVNCLTGCSHACRYCYARANALKRFRTIKTLDEWARPKLRKADVSKRRRKVDGPIMFPTTHDILPEFLPACREVIERILRAGNRLLIVSKPHLKCIRELCLNLRDFREQILFRFTIGADDDKLLSYWEPGAPDFYQRVNSLHFAQYFGYATSVSIEPMLDSANVGRLIRRIEKFVTDTIWVGKLNQIRSRALDASEEAIRAIEAGQTPERIAAIYEEWKNHPKLRWKETIKQVLGLPMADRAGLDI